MKLASHIAISLIALILLIAHNAMARIISSPRRLSWVPAPLPGYAKKNNNNNNNIKPNVTHSYKMSIKTLAKKKKKQANHP